MVVASSRQHFDLVSKDYYADEVAYQKVIDAGKNQAELPEPVSLHANEQKVTIDFPTILKDKSISGTIQFYSPVNSEWDKKVDIKLINNAMDISRVGLRKTMYTIKIDLTANGKKYYQETEINLNS